MSKEYEKLTKEQKALNGLANFIIMHGNNDDYDASAIEWHDILKKTLTPPTANEVCEALSEWLNKEVPDLFNYKVYYDNGGFHYYNTEDFEDYLVEYYEVDGTMTLSVFLPPHLVTLIGRFYEGVGK